MNWPGRRREEGGSKRIAHIRVIQVLPVADNWIDEDGLLAVMLLLTWPELTLSCSALVGSFLVGEKEYPNGMEQGLTKQMHKSVSVCL